MKRLKFGTGGWRAVIGEEFTRETVELISQAIAVRMTEEGKAENGIIIGYDRRFLSAEAAEWIAQVMAAFQIRSRIISREAPTPMIMFAVKEYGTNCGIAVTASHNPAVYNGIKVFLEGGRDADAEWTDRIEEYIGRIRPEDIKRMPLEDAAEQGFAVRIDPFNRYIDSIMERIDRKAIAERNLKIAIDPMYGVGRTALLTVLCSARCDVEVLHERRDALFGGRLPAPNSKTLAGLSNYVTEHGCDIGFATDGDADRLGVIDETGEFIHPNKILVLLYYYLLKYRGFHGPAVRNIATTRMLDRIAAAFSEQCFEVPVGFKYVTAKMQETDAVIGGESSGGLTVRGHINGKDGIYAAALMTEMLAVTGKSPEGLYGQITAEFGSLEMAEAEYHLTEARKRDITERLFIRRELPEEFQRAEDISYLDGCKVSLDRDSWIIGRFSGTEPVFRIFCEAAEMREAERMIEVLEAFLNLERK